MGRVKFGGRHGRRMMSTIPVQPTSVKAARVNMGALNRMYAEGTPIAVLTAYDHPTAQAMNDVADVILVGDSVGMVVHGHATTIPVTKEAMLLHCAAVARGAARPFLVGDLPFGSYPTSDDAVRTAVRFIQEGGMQGVKLEGGRAQAGKITSLTAEGIPVMAHVGLLPQTAPLSGGFTLQGKTAQEALRIVEDALAVSEAGAMSVVLELVPAQVASFITALLTIPTIGIGSGPDCSGQVLVAHDLLGLHPGRKPSFVKQYASLGRGMQDAFTAYCEDVKAGRFPGPARPSRNAISSASAAAAGGAGAAAEAPQTLFADTGKAAAARAAGSTLPSAVDAATAAASSPASSSSSGKYHRDMDLAEFHAFAQVAMQRYGMGGSGGGNGNASRAAEALQAAAVELEAAVREAQAAARAAAEQRVAVSGLGSAAAPAAAAATAPAPSSSVTAGMYPSTSDADLSARHRPLFSALEPSISVAIVGTGAVASLLAAQLGRNPLLSCVDMYGRWRPRVEAINAQGIRWRPLGSDVEEAVMSSAPGTGAGTGAGVGTGRTGPLLRAFCLDDIPSYRALLEYTRASGMAPGGAAGASPAPTAAPSGLPMGDKRYDVVILAGKALDVPEQALAAALLVRSVQDAEAAPVKLGYGASTSSSPAAPAAIPGRPGIILPMYNGAYSLEYVMGVVGRLREAALEKEGQGTGAAAGAAAAAEPSNPDAPPAAPATPAPNPSLPILSTLLGPAIAAHLASLRPLGQVGYGVTSMGAALGPGPDASVACTGIGPTYLCVDPLFTVGAAQEGLLLPPEHALRHAGTVPEVFSSEGVMDSPLQASVIPAARWNAHRWAKLAINAVLNPTVALLGTTNSGFVPRAQAARAALTAGSAGAAGKAGLAAMAEEACAAALHRAGVRGSQGRTGGHDMDEGAAGFGASMPPMGRMGRNTSLPLPEWAGVRTGADLLDKAEKAAAATGDNINSMWADALSGRPCEVDFISGAVVEAAEEARPGSRAEGQRAAVAALHGRERALGIRDAADPADPVTARVEGILRIARQATAELKH